ncbi:helix-hairpin-helix domain-containing protein [Lederbergia lenta]|uniref:helix-hairpin-helix domain-containing protein n=1 Tax=Lederbergia lenta TaxID=1467 RepID=UPI00203D8BB2|nr:helix-hairpin-helix domain-containing protein [Lederbergia lenta]MCM3111353.1 helix-hairpin-helix domain-containing protein [Lederbergia lenta]
MKIWIERYKTMLICVIVILLAGFLYLSRPKEKALQDPVDMGLQWQDEDTPKDILGDNEEANIRIFVDVKGWVQKPGLYEAKDDDRVFDIIELAGGLLEEADENQINFAEKIHDEMVVYIPKIGEIFDEVPQGTGTQSKKDEKVNLNKADNTELETLPGIGPAKAAAIIEYREQNGPYQQIEDLKKISGIGPKSFEKLQNLISVK